MKGEGKKRKSLDAPAREEALFFVTAGGWHDGRGEGIGPRSAFSTKKSLRSAQRASQATINMQISARTLL